MRARWQWLKSLAVGLAGVFFLLRGIDALRCAYGLKNPHEFIVYFFSASLMILISTVAIIYPLARIRLLFPPGEATRAVPHGQDDGKNREDEDRR